MNRKPEAIEYEDGDGIFTLRCKTKEEAQKAMQSLVDSDFPDKFKVKLDKIKETIMFAGHRKCGGYTIGDSTCWECGEDTNHVGRRTFIYDDFN